MFEKPPSPGIQLLIFFSLFVLMGWAGDILFAGILAAITEPELQDIDWTDPRIVFPRTFISQLFGFVLALMVFLRITKQKFSDVIDLKKKITGKALLITLGVFVGSMFVMQLLAMVNQPLGELIPDNYFIQLEEETNVIQRKLLIHDSPGQLIISLIVLCAVPAIAEELIFRGLLIRKLMESSGGKVHFSVLISSVIFAGIHLQPLKLLPMIFLGACLGYVYHYFKDIKYSMFLHFLINASQILVYFFWGEVLIDA